MKCPKCGYAQAAGEECAQCGIVFEKYFALQERKRARRLKGNDPPPPSGPESMAEEPPGRVSAFLQQYFWVPFRTPWRPVAKELVIALTLLYAYIFYSITREPYYQLFPEVQPMEYLIAQLFKQVDLVFHEGGHWIFGIFGNRSLTVLGGSLNQVLVPCIVAAAFWLRRDASGFAFGLIWIGINLMEVGIYMADARDPVLPLIGGGDPFEGHDWLNLFNWWDLWRVDTVIAKTTYRVGWFGMLAAMLWFAWTGFRNLVKKEPENPIEFD